MQLNELPADVLFEVFGFAVSTVVPDIGTLATVCKYWKEMLVHCPLHLKFCPSSVSVFTSTSRRLGLCPSVRVVVRRFRRIQRLDLSQCRYLVDEDLLDIAECLPALWDLNMYKCHQISDEGLLNLVSKGENRLRALNMGWCKRITDLGLRVLATSRHGPSMVHLGLHWCREISDLGMKYIASDMKSLEFLDVSWCHRVGTRGIRELAASSLQRLGTLLLDCCYEISDMAPMCHMGALKILNVSSCHHITSLGSLHAGMEQLVLNYCHGLTDAGIRSLQAVRSLRSLSLSNCTQLTNESMSVVGTLTNLEELDVSSCTLLDDAGFAKLASLVALRKLDMSCCMKLSDEGLERLLPSLSSLVQLNMGCCINITDRGLDFVREGILYLNLCGCERISDAGYRRMRCKLWHVCWFEPLEEQRVH